MWSMKSEDDITRGRYVRTPINHYFRLIQRIHTSLLSTSWIAKNTQTLSHSWSAHCNARNTTVALTSSLTAETHCCCCCHCTEMHCHVCNPRLVNKILYPNHLGLIYANYTSSCPHFGGLNETKRFSQSSSSTCCLPLWKCRRGLGSTIDLTHTHVRMHSTTPYSALHSAPKIKRKR
jgi:hypothetical protein